MFIMLLAPAAGRVPAGRPDGWPANNNQPTTNQPTNNQPTNNNNNPRTTTRQPNNTTTQQPNNPTTQQPNKQPSNTTIQQTKNNSTTQQPNNNPITHNPFQKKLPVKPFFVQIGCLSVFFSPPASVGFFDDF